MFKLIIALFTLSTIASARQYIQCAHPNSWDRAVINLNGDQSTYFMTTGVHDPDEIRVLKTLELSVLGDDFNVYTTSTGPVREEITIATEYIDRALGYFPVSLKLIKLDSGYSQTIQMGCFSSIH